MYAIVEIAGKQYRAEKGKSIYVHRLDGKQGDKVEFGNVLLASNSENKVTVGSPSVKNAAVKATIVDHVKGDKVIVFKKKRRKGYRVKNGHRQSLTKIQIDEIV